MSGPLKPPARTWKKGQYALCRYAQDPAATPNGDLIAGRVESFRSNGIVQLTDLLSGSPSFKHVTVLNERNIRVDKRDAEVVVAAAGVQPADLAGPALGREQQARRRRARAAAVALVREVPPMLPGLEPPLFDAVEPPLSIDALARGYKALGAGERLVFLQEAGILLRPVGDLTKAALEGFLMGDPAGAEDAS